MVTDYNNFSGKIIFFEITYLLYFICIIVSIIIYSIFVNIFKNTKKDQKENEYRIWQICGYIIYSQGIKKGRKGEPPGLISVKLLCQSIQNCCDKIVYPGLISLICCGNKEDNDINECLPFFCTCCWLYKENNFEKEKEFFRYCYQEKRRYKFFSEFISNDVQKKLVPLLIEYFLLQLMVIGFEEDYQISNINKLNFLFVFIISLLLFFYFSISFYEIIKLWRPVINESSDILSQISSAIISDGAHGILIFNSIFSFVFSC